MVAVVRPAADSIVSGVWMTEAATVVVAAAVLLAGLTTLPIGLGARMLSMVKSEVGDDMVATEEPPGREETGSRPRCRVGVSSEPIGLLANRSRVASVASFPRLAVT